MKSYQNKHKGETCLIIGNGPSLRPLLDQNHPILTKYPTFGSNRIYMRFMPTYFVCVNPLVVEQNSIDIEALECDKFIRAGMRMSGNQLNCRHPRKAFSMQPDLWVYEGYTVTFVSLQLAYWMGFTTVLMVGVDHRYAYDGRNNEARKMTTDDPNHFDPEYFKGQWWNNPDLDQSELSYWMAEEAYKKDGRRILNLTENTALDVFEKDSLADW